MMTDKELLERYPWLRRCSLYRRDEILEGTMLDDMPDGWRAAFGEEMCEEINNEILTWDKISLENFHIAQIKEKWGVLRFYVSHGSKKLYEIIDKYEQMSRFICIDCGAPATKMSCHWISPYCDACAEKMNGRRWGNEKFVPIDQYYRKGKEDEI